MSSPQSDRRKFVKACLGVATMAAANPSRVAWGAPVRQHTRTLLTDEKGQPLQASTIGPDDPYVFHYPFQTTPCFLLNLGKPLAGGASMTTATEGDYTWQGGAGPRESIVAFAAICTHKLSYPTRTLSFLNYRSGPVRFESAGNGVQERSQLIYCCSERSAYDPANGAAVLGGPATQPLAAIELEYDAASDQLYAVGTRGGELYDAFFDKFSFRLALDHQIADVRAPVTDQTIVYPHASYSRHAVAC